MNIRTLFLASTLVAPAPAYAYFDTGNDLYTNCSSEPTDAKSTFNVGLCFGYIRGIADNMNLATDIRSSPTCIPGGADTRQIKDVVMKYMDDHPDRRDMPAVMIVTLALVSAWPKCSAFVPSK